MHQWTEGQVPIIGCGGISSAQDAIEFAKAGATIIQLYTALAMQGPHIVSDIKDELTKYLKTHNLSWMQLVQQAKASVTSPTSLDKPS